MPAPVKSATNMDAMVYEVIWKAETIGFTKEVDPTGLKLLKREKRIGELNDLLIDEEIYGLEGTIKIVLHEVKEGRIRQLMPWAGSTGAFAINPTVVAGTSKYGLAQILRLHPKGDAGVTNDIALLKTFPNVTLPKNGGGQVWRELLVEFDVFPDQTALTASTPTVVYGYVGEPPA